MGGQYASDAVNNLTETLSWNDGREESSAFVFPYAPNEPNDDGECLALNVRDSKDQMVNTWSDMQCTSFRTFGELSPCSLRKQAVSGQEVHWASRGRELTAYRDERSGGQWKTWSVRD